MARDETDWNGELKEWTATPNRERKDLKINLKIVKINEGWSGVKRIRKVLNDHSLKMGTNLLYAIHVTF